MSDQATADAAATTDVPALTEETHEVADRIVRRYPVSRSALLPLLHLVQSVQHHITDEGIAFCAEKVGLTRAEVGAVATFYTMYKREPVGDWLLSVCTNPPCKIAGGQEIFDNYVAALDGRHVDPETRVMVEHAECLGICDGAPVVQVNYEMYGPMTVAEGDQLLAACRKGEPPVSPWSGERPPTFSEVEYDLSGANDAWEAELHKAALQQIAHDDPPTYRTGETDIPVTHPGGDPAGVGGALFRQQAQGNGQVTAGTVDPEELAPTPDVVTDDQPAPTGAEALDGDVEQRIAPGAVDDETITAAGAGEPTAHEVDRPLEQAEDPGAVAPPLDAEAMTDAPGPSDQPGDVGVLGRGGARRDDIDPTDEDGEVTDPDRYADDPDQAEDTASGAAEDTEDTTGLTEGDPTDVAPGEVDATAAAEGEANLAPEIMQDDDADDGSDADDASDADDDASDDEES